MDIKNQETKGLKCTLQAHIPAKDITPVVEKELQEKGKDAVITGFRKGKAPISVLRQKYGSQALSSAFEKLVSLGVNNYIKKEKLKTSGHPNISLEGYDEKKGLDIKVEIDLLPELKLPKLDSMKLTHLVVENPEERLEDALTAFSQQHSVEKPLSKERPAQLNDVAIIDFEGFIGDTAFKGGKGTDHHLKLGSGQFIPGFEDQIVGKEKGQAFDVKVTFPEAYHSNDLAGKEAVFKVTLKDIKESAKAELNDELAKKSGFKSLSDLKEAMKKHLETDTKNMEQRYLKRQFLISLANSLKGDVPENMLNKEVDSIWGEYKRASETDKSLEKLTEKEFKEQHIELAKSRVLLGLGLAEIGNSLKVSLNPEFVREEILRYARQYPGQEEQIFKAITSNKEALMEFQAPLYEDKVTEEALKKVKVTEKKVAMKELLSAIDKLENDALEKLDQPKKKSKK